MEKYTRDLQRTNQHERDRPEAEDPTSAPYTFCLRGVVIRLTDCESATNATVTVGRSESDCSCSLVLI